MEYEMTLWRRAPNNITLGTAYQTPQAPHDCRRRSFYLNASCQAATRVSDVLFVQYSDVLQSVVVALCMCSHVMSVHCREPASGLTFSLVNFSAQFPPTTPRAGGAGTNRVRREKNTLKTAQKVLKQWEPTHCTYWPNLCSAVCIVSRNSPRACAGRKEKLPQLPNMNTPNCQ